jgi:hypothetical protein
MGGTYRTLGGSDKFRDVFIGNNQRSRTHVITTHSWRNNNNISLCEMGFEGVEWI